MSMRKSRVISTYPVGLDAFENNLFEPNGRIVYSDPTFVYA